MSPDNTHACPDCRMPLHGSHEDICDCCGHSRFDSYWDWLAPLHLLWILFFFGIVLWILS